MAVKVDDDDDDDYRSIKVNSNGKIFANIK